MEGYYYSGRRSVKWWKRVFTYIIEASILNAFVLDAYRPDDSADDSTPLPPRPPHHSRDSLHFRLALAGELIGDFSNRVHTGRPSVTNSLRRNWSTPHLPVGTPNKKRCAMCRLRGVRSETKIQCSVCKVHLCVITHNRNCFYDYHTLPVLR